MFFPEPKPYGTLDKVPAVVPKYSDLRDVKPDFHGSLRSTPPAEDLVNQPFTHGYVHGHVHQHKDHMHIHGHIHNHDHTLAAPSAQAPHSDDLSACKEIDHFNLCEDIYCDDLDDCYYYHCDQDAPEHANTEVNESQPECCDDPRCLTEVSGSICTDPVCTGNERHDNSLCDSQNSRLSIFENLIQNVSKNIEQYSAPAQPAKRLKVDSMDSSAANSNFHIHFPHHCHSESAPLSEESTSTDLNTSSAKNFSSGVPVLSSAPSSSSEPVHTVHHSCFHAKLPANMAESTFLNSQKETHSDYDFFVQFNNLCSDTGLSESVVKDEKTSPNHLAHPCQWEQCYEQVLDSSLFDHVFNDHIKKEYHLEPESNELTSSQQPRFGCEWNNCDFVETDLKLFLDHLYTHTLAVDNQMKNAGVLEPQAVSMLTPTSIESAHDMTGFDLLPQIPAYDRPDKREHDVNITQVKISPKKCAHQPDSTFSCKWQLGTSSDGQPILCNKTHSDEGELQKHLQDDHIGHGKARYRCCWHGCERNGGKDFTQRQKVYRHIHMHTGYKPCVCDECGLRFAVPAMLKQHQRMHSGERPYKCTTCGKAFSTSSALGIHNRTHSGVKPSQCTWPGCGRKFNERSNFHKHLKTHTKSYKCDVCNEECSSRKDLTLHRKRAHLK